MFRDTSPELGTWEDSRQLSSYFRTMSTLFASRCLRGLFANSSSTVDISRELDCRREITTSIAIYSLYCYVAKIDVLSAPL